MSRLKQDKLSEMLAAAEAGRQAADQRSRRLEIKFARSDKGHALMQSAKLQASVATLEKQVTQLQTDSQHKVILYKLLASTRSGGLPQADLLFQCRSSRHQATWNDAPINLQQMLRCLVQHHTHLTRKALTHLMGARDSCPAVINIRPVLAQ